jgi:hypothetical protein
MRRQRRTWAPSSLSLGARIALRGCLLFLSARLTKSLSSCDCHLRLAAVPLGKPAGCDHLTEPSNPAIVATLAHMVLRMGRQSGGRLRRFEQKRVVLSKNSVRWRLGILEGTSI